MLGSCGHSCSQDPLSYDKIKTYLSYISPQPPRRTERRIDMSFFHFIEKSFHWEEGSIKEFEKLGSSLLLYVEFTSTASRCPYCHHKILHIKDYRDQKVLLGHWNTHPVSAIVHKRRFFCLCCHKTFYEKIPGVEHYQRRSNDVKNSIIQACSELASFKAIARSHGVSVSTVIRYFDGLTFKRPLHLPEVLSLDEFRGNAHGQRYQVAVNDPQRHETLDILPKRTALELIRYFSQFSRAERLKVKFVVMDLSSLFRKVIRTMFPGATIIGDRFHIQRLVIWALERVRKNVQKLFDEKRIYFKRNKHILNKRGDCLTEEELASLREILKQSSELQRAYALKEAFFKVFSMKERSAVASFLSRWLSLVEESGVEEFKSVIKTFTDWKTEILEGLSQAYSNGFTEGMNNKIKVLKRVAFGFRNFERFRSRILLLSMVKLK